MSIDTKLQQRTHSLYTSDTVHNPIVLKLALLISLLVNSWLFFENYYSKEELMHTQTTFDQQMVLREDKYSLCSVERVNLHEIRESLRADLAQCREEIAEVHRNYTFCVKEEVANWVKDGFQKLSAGAQNSYKAVADTLNEIPITETFNAIVNHTAGLKNSSAYNATTKYIKETFDSIANHTTKKEVTSWVTDGFEKFSAGAQNSYKAVADTLKEIPIGETFDFVINQTANLGNSSGYNATIEYVKGAFGSIANHTANLKKSSAYNATGEYLGALFTSVGNKTSEGYEAIKEQVTRIDVEKLSEYGQAAGNWLGNAITKLSGNAKSFYESAKGTFQNNSTQGSIEEDEFPSDS